MRQKLPVQAKHDVRLKGLLVGIILTDIGFRRIYGALISIVVVELDFTSQWLIRNPS